MPQQMFGQISQGMHPAGMPVSGMQAMPMGPMAPMPVPVVANGSLPSSTNSGPLAPEQGPSKVSNGDDKGERAALPHQMQLPRACWTPVEEEVLVKTYAEFMIGKKLKKINRKTWEAIARDLFQESKLHMPQVSMKSWMQCKDKWNNMIKKHKLQRAEYLRGSSEGNTRERTTLYEAMERVLTFENEGEFPGYSEQDGQFIGEEDSVTMVTKGNETNKVRTPVEVEKLTPVLAHDVSAGNWEKSAGSGDKRTDNHNEDCYPEINSTEKQVNMIYADDDDDEEEQNSDHVEVSASNTIGPIQSKRAFTDETQEGIARKRGRLSATEESNVNEKLCQILTQQTELLERTHAQHCELIQQVRISEENTRMMVMQAIKDLGTILNKLIKSEQY